MTKNINSFSGINFADPIIAKASVYKTIDELLIKPANSYAWINKAY